MNKMLSLIKATMTQDMGLFKLQSKKQSSKSKILVPIIIAIILMVYMGGYMYGLIDQFKESNNQYVALTLFTFIFCLITIIEGFYKSSSLLFNCKDDQLLLSLPLSKKQVLFIRMFKFYLFEFLFSGLFLLPCMAVYGYMMNVPWTFYLTSIVALFIFPIVPIVISCIFGFLVTYITTKFKGKNLIQSIIVMALLLVVLYYTFNMDYLSSTLVNNAEVIHNTICNIYFPIKLYISLVTNFDILTFIIFIGVNLLIFIITLLIMSKFYFKLNSTIKNISVKHNNKPYVVKKHSPVVSFVKKELSKFLYTPVFITNAGFGLVMFVAACVAVSFKIDAISTGLIEKVPELTTDMILSYIPIVTLVLVAMASFMTSITSSMISLESKKFYILKSLPIKSSMVVLYKVIAALVIMIPCILLGDLIMIFRFHIDIVSIIFIIYASILLPFISELIGIMVNLKYPKMDATNDTEIVKQSMSSMISVFIGMGLFMISAGLLIGLLIIKLNVLLIELIYIILFTIVAIILWLHLTRTADKKFNDIQV